MKELKIKISDFLIKENSFVSVEEDGKKMRTQQGRPYFSLEDIEQEFGGIDNFLDVVKEEYSKGEVCLKKIKNGKQTIYLRILLNKNNQQENQTEEENNENNQKMEVENNSVINTPGQAFYPQNNYPQVQYLGNANYGLGFVNVPQATIIDGAVKSERLEDLKNRVEELKEEVKDLRSENRILREENASLKIKVDTKDREKELDLKQAELDRKGFFDGEAGKQLMQGLSGAIPIIATKMMGASTPAVALAGADEENLSEIKRNFIEVIKNPQVGDDLVKEWYELIFSKYGEQN